MSPADFLTRPQRGAAASHGQGAVGGGVIADLRYTSAWTHRHFEEFGLGSAHVWPGMPSYANRLSPEEVRLIQDCVLARASELVRTDTR